MDENSSNFFPEAIIHIDAARQTVQTSPQKYH